MATLHGSPLPPDFEDGKALSAEQFNAVKNYWVTDELPDTAENGDVVFVADGGVVSAVGGGKVLQVVRATAPTDAMSMTTSTSYVDVTGMNVTITPQVLTSNILIIAAFLSFQEASTDDVRALYSVTDSLNNPISGSEEHWFGTQSLTGAGTRQNYAPQTLIAWASPATLSPLTYKLRFKSYVATCTSYVWSSLTTSQMYAIEVSA